MGEIKRFDFEMHNHSGCDMCYCDMCYAEIEEAEDGEYIEYEDHLKAIAEAKKGGVREFLTKIRDHCRDETFCDGCPMVHIDMVHIDCNNMSKATDEDIKKVVRGYEMSIMRKRKH